MPVLIGEMGHYDRWKTDTDWGRREEKCQHCGGTDFECDRYSCARCGAKGCSNTLVPEEGDEWECPPCNERCNETERAEVKS